MEETHYPQQDPNLALQLLLDLAHEQSLDTLLNKLMEAAISGPGSNIVCAQVWLLEKGDRCSVCPHSAVCADQSRCLHLHIGRLVKENSNTTEEQNDINNPDRRIPLSMGLLGSVALSGQQHYIQDCRPAADQIQGLEWLDKKQIRGFAVTPIVFRGEVLGVTAAFTRTALMEIGKPWVRVFADFIGGAIVNARSFEEIQRLKAQLELQNAYLKELILETKAFGNLIGQSAALKRIVSQIDLVAPTEASVLILGETGTGKELVAYEIHNRSNRKNGPMVRVNCASIPKDLFESEFFGHVKGAFTGALKDRPGRFETAEGGTLFLDEIGEIPLEMQGKLLRVLQEKRYEAVGEDHTRVANVRIVAATNRDLKEAVDSGLFREDLYYRINVFPVLVAPLRERKDDIPPLVKHFIDISVKELRCPYPRLTRAGLTTLLNYDWPGNVRELRNVVERAVILSGGGILQFNLPSLKGNNLHSKYIIPALKSSESDGYLTESEIRRMERENLLRILEKTGWKIKGAHGAAELLGIKPTTLLSRMKKMGIERPEA
ncbi:MAG: sigma 54-interacting transcriptional regulator [Verrucomicrobia bacterium]|jgi:transcriptional regulator with GAF, ATPase, and Fis domain|nr:sigma 54-interacting transcriptional regulator [Verrucomicrobiota bacterium]